MTTKKKRSTNPTPGPTGDPVIDEAIAKANQALAAEVEAASKPRGNPLTLGPRVIAPEKIADKLVSRASGASEEWFAQAQAPRKNPIQEGIKAEGKYVDKMKTVISEGRRAKALSKVTDDDLLQGVKDAGADALRTGIERKKGKVLRRFKVLQPLYELLAKTIDTFPTDTEAQRENKMKAARRGMILVGKARRGEISPTELAAEIKKLGGVTA